MTLNQGRSMPLVKVGEKTVSFPDDMSEEEISGVLTTKFQQAGQMAALLDRPEFGAGLPIDQWDDQGMTPPDRDWETRPFSLRP